MTQTCIALDLQVKLRPLCHPVWTQIYPNLQAGFGTVQQRVLRFAMQGVTQTASTVAAEESLNVRLTHLSLPCCVARQPGSPWQSLGGIVPTLGILY